MTLKQTTSKDSCHNLVVGLSSAHRPENFKWMIEELSA